MLKITLKLNAFFIIICLISLSSINAGSSNLKYIDLDGDGINDNFADIDNNNIPDDFQQKIEISLPASTTQFTGFSSGSEKDKVGIKLSLSEQFSLRKYTIRCLSTNRCDLENEFGTRLGVSSSSGGSCAGGVCF